MEIPFRHLPIEIHNFIERSSDNDVGFIIMVHGAIDSIFSVIDRVRSKGFKISHLEWSEERLGNNVLFMVINDARDQIDAIIGTLEALEVVDNVEVAPEFNNYIYCPYFFPVFISGERAMLFEKSLLVKFINNLYEMFIPDMIKSFLFHVGKAYGYGIYEYYSSLKGSGTLENLVEYLKIVGLLTGGGLVEGFQLNEDEITISIKFNMECEVLKELGKRDRSNFLKGVLEGVFEKYFSTKIVVKEHECVTDGAEKCVFTITPIKAN